MIMSDALQPAATLEKLDSYMAKIDRIFKVEALLAKNINEDDIIGYYEQSDFGYKVFHSTEGSVHMALNFDGKFNKHGYYGQARLVETHIQKNNAANILELASGKGFNTVYLSKRFPLKNFAGIDLTPAHVAQAQKAGANMQNAKFALGNFMHLEFKDEQFDLVFEIESICHATNMQDALSEAYRVLKPGGKMVLFDGFRTPKFHYASNSLKNACKLVEVSMAVGEAWLIDEWLKTAEDVGFVVREFGDISEAIMPNLVRLQKMARGYFKYPAIANALVRVLPSELVKNSIAGLLMPFTIDAGVQRYYQIVLEKR